MSDFGINPVSDYEKKRVASLNVVRKILEIVQRDPNTRVLDLGHLYNSDEGELGEEDARLMRASASDHLHYLEEFNNDHYPGLPIYPAIGFHKVSTFRDVLSAKDVAIRSTTLLPDDGRVMQEAEITEKDGNIMTSKTVFISDDTFGGNEFSSRHYVRRFNAALHVEALTFNENNIRPTIISLLCGAADIRNLQDMLEAVRIVVLERYDTAETDRFISELEQHYFEVLSTQIELAEENKRDEKLSLSQLQDLHDYLSQDR